MTPEESKDEPKKDMTPKRSAPPTFAEWIEGWREITDNIAAQYRSGKALFLPPGTKAEKVLASAGSLTHMISEILSATDLQWDLTCSEGLNREEGCDGYQTSTPSGEFTITIKCKPKVA